MNKKKANTAQTARIKAEVRWIARNDRERCEMCKYFQRQACGDICDYTELEWHTSAWCVCYMFEPHASFTHVCRECARYSMCREIKTKAAVPVTPGRLACREFEEVKDVDQ